ncbi:MAG TPA: hypothetical protein VM733_07970 [Thermoanaerobaculia bacterium]|nr:hypothetical protein [Thermoanaerobaculia bacterium]
MSNSRAPRSLIVFALIFVAAARQNPHAAKLRALAADTLLVDTVRAQNAKELPLVAVKVLDQRWFVGRESVLARQTITGACADRLRAFLTANPDYSEAFLLDAQGAVVCANARTTNYWYGEEPRWQTSMKGAIFANDEGLISVPVLHEAKVVGVMTAKALR